jgi:phosphoribosylformylglycinamidine synthase
MDPQAEAVGESLTSLGYGHIDVEWVGRQLTMVIETTDDEAARITAEELCARILVNPNLETHEITVKSLEGGPG